MINTNLNIKNNNNNATASTDCISEYLFCAQYFKNWGRKNSLSRFSKFQNSSRTRLKKWPFSRITQVEKKIRTAQGIQGIPEPVATLYAFGL